MCEDEELEEPAASIITTVTVVAVTASVVVAAAATTVGVAAALGCCCSGAAATTGTTVAVLGAASAGVAGGGTVAAVHLLKKHGLVGSAFENTNVTRVEAQLQVLSSSQPITGVADTPLVTLPEAINYMLELLHDPQYKHMSRLKADSSASFLPVQPNFSNSSILSTSNNFSNGSILSAGDDPYASTSTPPLPPASEASPTKLLQEHAEIRTDEPITKSESMKKIKRAKTIVRVLCVLARCFPLGFEHSHSPVLLPVAVFVGQH